MEIFLYTLSIMYSPGPVNFIGLNSGLIGQLKRTMGFFLGVGSSMFVLLILMGYAGESLISREYSHYIAIVGALYTFYLAYKMMRVNVEVNLENVKVLTYWNGFLIQTLNPKASLVILPVTTIMYPSANITGVMISVVSFLISLGAAGAPFVYAYAGAVLGKRITNKLWFTRLNQGMGLMLISSGAFMLRDFLKGMGFI